MDYMVDYVDYVDYVEFAMWTFAEDYVDGKKDRGRGTAIGVVQHPL